MASRFFDICRASKPPSSGLHKNGIAETASVSQIGSLSAPYRGLNLAKSGGGR
jgi:hypothetical protein